MPARRLLITDHPWPDLDIERSLLAPHRIEVVDAPDGSEETLSRLATDVQAIATCWAKVTDRVIAASPDCRIVCRMGIGLDNIAIPVATALGIPVTNIPDYCVEEVADHALALMLSLARNIGWFHLRTKQGEYQLSGCPPMNRLRGRTLGLIGLGRIGSALATRAAALGMTVIAHTRSQQSHGTGCRMVSLEELLATSHILSLHAPLTDETRHLLNSQAFARMQRGTFLINTSRGGLIDQSALRDAIQSGIVAGAGLDVFDPEPPDLSAPLFRDERVIVTPHAAFVSEESLIELRERVARQVIARFNGERPENVVNPEVLESRSE